MDYEKRFEEVLKAVKELKEANPADRGIQNWVNGNFPELAESEDEEIRKTLIDFHKSTIDINGIKGEKIIAWLEKQGEQKPFDYSRTNISQKDYAEQYPVDNNNELTAEDLQSDFETEITACSLRYPELSFAKMSRIAKRFYDLGKENVGKQKHALRPQRQWKVVDKEIYVKEPALAQRKDKSDPYHGYVVCHDHTLTPDVYERYIMLSDIYSQKQWKPTEEQMKQLHKYCIDNRPLSELYEQLKAL